MKNVKKYRDFCNEEINLKNALIGGAIAASTIGCDSTELNKRQGSEWITTPTPIESATEIKELPNKFEMDEVIMTIGTDMNINVGDQQVGKVEERTLNWGKTFEYFDNKGHKIATGKEKALSLLTTIDIYDSNDKKIGTFEEELFKNFFSIKTYYSIKDASGKLIAESEKMDWLSTNIEIFSPSGEILCKMKRPAFNLLSDSWKVEVLGNIDKRLIVFIPCYKTSADNERKSEDDKNNSED